MNRITITLPWPSSSLHAHAKGHWRWKAKATKTHRKAALLASLAAGVQRIKQMRIAIVDYHFYMPDKRNRDAANLIQSCKPYIDGIADSGPGQRAPG